ncbi:hypothetical protein K0M31_013248, partial [Melipona bicolor]
WHRFLNFMAVTQHRDLYESRSFEKRQRSNEPEIGNLSYVIGCSRRIEREEKEGRNRSRERKRRKFEAHRMEKIDRDWSGVDPMDRAWNAKGRT